MPWIVKVEFLRGAMLANHAAIQVEETLTRYPTVWPSEDTLTLYARTYVTLARSNRLIGPNDLWIAAAALEHSVPLLTRNAEEFRRIEGLEVVAYATS
jgi:tRNA(fMet)-specific endonuclease VapC